jgi:drug/metabolite transporter (DMT)-like permease
MSPELIGTSAALGSAASWALGSVLFRQLGDRIPPVALTFAKAIAGGGLLGIVLLFVGFAPLPSETWLLLVLSGLLGVAVGDTLFFLALNQLGAHVVVILFTLGQLLTVLMGVWWLGESPGAADWAGIAAILTGVTIVMWSKVSDGEGKTRLIGLVFGLASILAMSVSIIIAKEALETAESIQATFIRILSGGIGVMVYGAMTRQLAGGLGELRHPGFLMFFFASVVIVTFGGFWLSLVAISHLDVSIANTLNATEPLFVLPLAAFILKEKITPVVVGGSVLTVIGIALIAAPW